MKIKFIKPFRFIGNAPDDGSDITVPVGYVVDLENDKSTQWLIDNGFAEKVEEGAEWLYDGVPYYGPAVSGIAKKFVPSYDEYRGDDVYDEARRRIGICYKTEEACQRFIDFLTAVEVVSHDDGFMKISRKVNYSPCGYGVYRGFGKSIIAEVSDMTVYAGEFYFDTYEHAKASVEAHQPEWQTILNYDWSKGEEEEDD